MAIESPQAEPSRATILIGYGAFGLDVLRRLLASTAPRGVLNWEQTHGGARSSERYLQDLALLWVRDRLKIEGQEADEEHAYEGSSLEMMRDLYRQIQQVPEDSTPELDLAQAMDEAADKLLSAASRATRSSVLPLGLDVIVLARPTGPEVIGILDRMLVLGMEKLAGNSNLQRAVQGSETLNFIEILDFDDYWEPSERALRVRRALFNSVSQWEKRRQRRQSSFGRCYLVDGLTRDGNRKPRTRIDEISLFLELLLFEGQRSGTLQRLYQPGSGQESLPATFGIRLMERSAGLLSRLAAARFGIGWLDYLAGSDVPEPDSEPLELERRLEPYRPAKLEALVSGGELRDRLRQRMMALEGELAALEPTRDDWPQLVRQRYEATVAELENELTAGARERMREISQNHLADLASDLRQGIGDDLHHPRRSVPLGAAVAAVEEALTELDDLRKVPEPALEPPTRILGQLARLHQEYRRFNFERIHVDGLRRWWLVLAAVLTAGLTPLALELLGEIPQPDPASSPLLLWASQVLRSPWIQNPITVATLILLLTWLVGRRALHRGIAARVERARRFYSDQQRGRFADRLRAHLSPGGALHAPVEHYLDRLLRDMELSVRSEVSRELGQIAGRLKERRREMIWLQGQLREFLKMHGLTVESRQHDIDRIGRDGTGIRLAMERREDFDRMLKSNPPSPERFRSTQSTRNPFPGWDQRYCESFLYPLNFIDDLSGVYKDPFLVELARPGEGPEQETRRQEFLDFLARHGDFDLAFNWKAQEGVTTPRRYCLMPLVWRSLPAVLPALTDLGMSSEHVLVGSDVARAYLLRIQTGVATRCLLEAG